MSLRFPYWKAIELGSLCGLLFGLLSEAILHSLFFYDSYAHPITSPDNLNIDLTPYPFNWWYLPLLWLVLVALASYFAHWCFAGYIKSSIWLWQIIGLTAVFVGCLASFIIGSYSWYLRYPDWETRILLEGIINSTWGEVQIFLFFLPFLLAFNLMFVTVLRRCKWQLQ